MSNIINISIDISKKEIINKSKELNDDNITYRIDLNNYEMEMLLRVLQGIDATATEDKMLLINEQEYFYNTLKEKILSPKKIKYSMKKHIAAARASESRAIKAKKKILHAINILREKNKPITPYSISKVSGVGFNTAKKYMNECINI